MRTAIFFGENSKVKLPLAKKKVKTNVGGFFQVVGVSFVYCDTKQIVL